MYYLKLIKARSYSGYGLHTTARNPIVTTEDEGIYNAALASGYFAVAAPDERPPKRPDNTGTIEAIDTMNSTKLRAYAKKKGIDKSWPNGTDTETIRADIHAALAAPVDADEYEDEDPGEQFMSGDGISADVGQGE